jgi:hypothetical protein
VPRSEEGSKSSPPTNFSLLLRIKSLEFHRLAERYAIAGHFKALLKQFLCSTPQKATFGPEPCADRQSIQKRGFRKRSRTLPIHTVAGVFKKWAQSFASVRIEPPPRGRKGDVSVRTGCHPLSSSASAQEPSPLPFPPSPLSLASAAQRMITNSIPIF